jgi:serine phosphatase RsbU (regulator of sigma subunit)
LYEIFDRHGRQLGLEGLRSILIPQGRHPLEQLLDRTLETVREYAAGQTLDGDVSLLGLQWA